MAEETEGTLMLMLRQEMRMCCTKKKNLCTVLDEIHSHEDVSMSVAVSPDNKQF